MAPDQNGMLMSSDIQLAPLVKTFDHGGELEGVFKGAGNSHFTFARERGGFHETTEIPGLGQGMRIVVHTDLKDLTPWIKPERELKPFG
jgi:hypothetical protein